MAGMTSDREYEGGVVYQGGPMDGQTDFVRCEEGEELLVHGVEQLDPQAEPGSDGAATVIRSHRYVLTAEHGPQGFRVAAYQGLKLDSASHPIGLVAEVEEHAGCYPRRRDDKEDA